MFNKTPIEIVVGMGRNTRAIGQENGLIWHVSDDLKRFKRLTLGCPVIMGRKTFESILVILGKPLPGRTNLVVTRNVTYKAPEDVVVCHSLSEAIDQAETLKPRAIQIGGGEELYRQALPLTTRIYATFFDDDSQGDAIFPDFTNDFIVEQTHPARQHKDLTYQWVDFVRKTG